MGFHLSRVISDETHYRVFLCKICNTLASLDTLVTPCNHPFCRSCLQEWIQQREAEGLTCRCPSCTEDLEAAESNSKPNTNNNNTTILFGNIPIRVQRLQDSQPLAYQVLRMVQVTCPTTASPGPHCNWTGDYANWERHKVEHEEGNLPNGGSGGVANGSGNGSAVVDSSSRPNDRDSHTIASPGGVLLPAKGEPTAAHHARTALAAQHNQLDTASSQQLGGDVGNEFDVAALQAATDRCDKLKKQANAKFNRGDVAGARELYTESLALVEQFPDTVEEVRILMASLYSNRAVTYFRERILPPSIEDCNMSLELDPKSEKTYIRKWRALSAVGHTDAATACLQEGLRHIPDSKKLADEIRKSQAPPATPMSRMTEYVDMGYSIASMSNYETIASKAPPHSSSSELEGGGGSQMGNPSPAALERSEKLKKQANAKFNKGDIEAARLLYSDAISCIPSTTGLNPDIKSMLGMLYSNRAVTYFRDKMYTESLSDCQNALELDPDAEKSYIRKSRALVGLNRHEEAFRCLDEAHNKLPSSKKIIEELEKALERTDDNGEGVQVMNDAGSRGAMSSFSGDFNNSVGSFNFCITPDRTGENANVNGAPPQPRGDDADYSEDLELADKLKRNANAKFNRGDISGARLLYTEALACLPNDRENTEVRSCLASLYANRAVTFFREKEFGPSTWDCDKALELDPISEKTYIRKARALCSLQKFDEAVACLEVGLELVPQSTKLDDERSKAKEQQAEALKSSNGNRATVSEQHERDFQVSYTSFDSEPSKNYAENGSSIASMSFFITPGREKPTLPSVGEGRTEEFSLPLAANEDLDRAEKLKKQANAKLNKGDAAGARVLYGEGLACLPPTGPQSAEGRELAASLYANRAVTFFREKKFSATVMDCDKSLQLDSKHEKSYIRKWRALMALGNFEDAYMCLQMARDELPNSDRLNEELSNATEQKELLTTVNHLLATGEYQEARVTLKPIVKTSDNVSLWLAAARADACLGFTESALERVNKVLLFNSKHPEALQVRGYAMFLSGEIEHGISLLKESLDVDIDRDSTETTDLLERCHQTFTAFSKGQARVKRGRYKDAVDLFSSAMKDGGRIPQEAPLYALLLTERAEASLLSQRYEDALADCNEAINLKNDNMTAWTVKVEVYFALGSLQEARDELAQVRKTWGAGNETIEDAYKKTDFELRLKKEDDDLHRLVAAVESGLPESAEAASERRVPVKSTGRSSARGVPSSRRPSLERRGSERGRPSLERRGSERGRPSLERRGSERRRPSLERRGSERERPSLERKGSERERPSLERKGSERERRSRNKRVPSQPGPKTPRSSSRSGRKKRGVGQSPNGRPPGDPIQ
jgi:tetratricopeptide (TPR) repeat protein